MATPIGTCKTPSGSTARVRALDRHDLAGIADAVREWHLSCTEVDELEGTG